MAHAQYLCDFLLTVSQQLCYVNVTKFVIKPPWLIFFCLESILSLSIFLSYRGTFVTLELGIAVFNCAENNTQLHITSFLTLPSLKSLTSSQPFPTCLFSCPCQIHTDFFLSTSWAVSLFFDGSNSWLSKIVHI